jgi:sec-independent protein translocase protein TatA
VGNLGPWEILIIAGVIVLLFGARKMPEMARSLGKSARILRAETKGMRNEEATDEDKPAVAKADERPEIERLKEQLEAAELREKVAAAEARAKAAETEQAQVQKPQVEPTQANKNAG